MNENVQVCPSCNRRTDDAYDKTDISEGRNRLVNLYNNIIRGLKPDQRKMINFMSVIALAAFSSTPILSLCSFHNTAIFLLIQSLIAELCIATVVVDFFRWKNFKLTERTNERQRLENDGFWAKRFDAVEILPVKHRTIILIILILMIGMFVFSPFLVFDMSTAISALIISLIGFFLAITALEKIFQWHIEYRRQLVQREREIREEMKMNIERDAKEVDSVKGENMKCCSGCGNQLNDDDFFCSACGVSVMKEKSPTSLFPGRSGRAEYWKWVLLVSGLSILSVVAFSFTVAPRLENAETVMICFGAIVGIVSSICMLPVTVRRLHDHNAPGWVLFILIPLSAIPYVSFITGIGWFVYLGCMRGTIGPNRYGPDPIAGDKRKG